MRRGLQRGTSVLLEVFLGLFASGPHVRLRGRKDWGGPAFLKTTPVEKRALGPGAVLLSQFGKDNNRTREPYFKSKSEPTLSAGENDRQTSWWGWGARAHAGRQFFLQ